MGPLVGQGTSRKGHTEGPPQESICFQLLVTLSAVEISRDTSMNFLDSVGKNEAGSSREFSCACVTPNDASLFCTALSNALQHPSYEKFHRLGFPIEASALCWGSGGASCLNLRVTCLHTCGGYRHH